MEGARKTEQEIDPAQILLEFDELIVLVLDREGRLAGAGARARELFPALELGEQLPGSVELANARRVSYGSGESRLTLIVAPAVDQSAYEDLRAGFTAAVSHELRTPLARLLLLIEKIERQPADAAEIADQARREVEQMDELVNDVLFLSELESGREVAALGTTAALPILKDVAADLSERAELAGVTLRVEGDPEIELPLRPRMLGVIAQNLCANAIRYAGEGATCTLSLKRTALGDLELSVSDDGAGIAAEHLPRLFERFYRADRVRTTRGSGLGLAIVKHVVTSAGGTVSAAGSPGKGLTIRCVFNA